MFLPIEGRSIFIQLKDSRRHIESVSKKIFKVDPSTQTLIGTTTPGYCDPASNLKFMVSCLDGKVRETF